MRWFTAALALAILLAGCGLDIDSTDSPTTSLTSTTLGLPPSSSASSSSPTTSSISRSDVNRPNSMLTPGVADPRVTQANLKSTVCSGSWSEKVRPPASVTNALKRKVAALYGISPFLPQNYEGDHLIAIGVGGLPADLDFGSLHYSLQNNFWDEPRGPDNDKKDALEGRLHRDLCAGRITLKVAQEHSLHFYQYWNTSYSTSTVRVTTTTRRVTATTRAPAPPSRNDPRFSTCREAKAAGYGPYYQGTDPEYDWYRDGDSDGIVCE